MIKKPDLQIQKSNSFLGRWSELKKQSSSPIEPATVILEDASQVHDKPLSEEDEQHRAEAYEPPSIHELTDEDMPAIETLDESSDYSGFLSSKVSAGLRKAAMAKLFKLPGFAVLDGLNDYDEDYTNFAPLGDIVTAEMTYRAEVEAKRQLEKRAREAMEHAETDQPKAQEMAENTTDEEVEAGIEEDMAEQLQVVDEEQADGQTAEAADDITQLGDVDV